MKGSTKQIAWAESIKQNVIAALNDEINKTNEESKTITDMMAKALDAEESAALVIDMFKDVRTGDARRVSTDVMVQVRINPKANAWARKVLNYVD